MFSGGAVPWRESCLCSAAGLTNEPGALSHGFARQASAADLKRSESNAFEPGSSSTNSDTNIADANGPGRDFAVPRVRGEARSRGSAMVEIALMAPWIFFLFVGIYDFGFYAYSAICTQNAARAAAIQTAANTSAQLDSLACVAAYNELSKLANVYQSTAPTGCTGPVSSGTTVSNAKPIAVKRQTLCDQAKVSPSSIICEAPGCADCGQDNSAASSQVSVTYKFLPLIAIPGVLPSNVTLTRVAEVRILAQ